MYSNSAFGTCHALLPSDCSFTLQEGEHRTRAERSGNRQELPKSVSGKNRAEGSNATVWGRRQQIRLSHLKRTWLHTDTHPSSPPTLHFRPSTVSSSKLSPILKLISVVRTVVEVLM